MSNDLYDFFEGKEAKFGELLKKMSDPDIYSWDLFKDFLIELIRDSDKFKVFLLQQIVSSEDKKDLYEEILIAFNLLNFDEKRLETIVFNDGRHRIKVNYDEVIEEQIV